jgi:PAS domain S-box-containing protein
LNNKFNFSILILDFIEKKDQIDFIGKLDMTLNEGISFMIEKEILSPNGSFWHEWSFSPFKNENGEIEFVVQFGRDIDDKKKALQELQDVEKRYNLLDHNVNDVIWMTDLNMKYSYVSSSIKNLLGYSPEEIRSMDLLDTISDRSKKEIRENLEEQIRDFFTNKLECPSPVTLEFLQKDKWGTEKWTEVSISFLTNDEGEPEGLMGVSRFVGGRKKAQLESQEKERKLTNILSSLYSSFIGLIRKDHTYEEFWGSKELDEKYGFDSSKLKGMSIFNFAPPDSKEDFRALVDNVFLSGEPAKIEVSGQLPTGEFWQMMSYSPFKNEEGEVEYVVQFATDTTDKNIAMRSLVDIEKKYRLLEENVSDVIWIADKDLNYTYVSTSTRDLTGYEPNDLIGTNVLDRVDKGSLAVVMEEHGKIISDFISGRYLDLNKIQLELELSRKDGGKVWTEINISLVRDESGDPSGVIGVTRDISDRKEMEKELLKKDKILDSITKMGSLVKGKENWKEGVHLSLEDLGRATDVSRIYIFKNEPKTDERIYTSQIIEWVNEGIEAQMDNPDLHNFCLNEGFDRWIEELGNGGTISGDVSGFPEIEKEVLEFQSILSIVVVPIFDKEKWWGFIGFDECKLNRTWNEDEVKVLDLVGTMLGSLITSYGLN